MIKICEICNNAFETAIKKFIVNWDINMEEIYRIKNY